MSRAFSKVIAKVFYDAFLREPSYTVAMMGEEWTKREHGSPIKKSSRITAENLDPARKIKTRSQLMILCCYFASARLRLQMSNDSTLSGDLKVCLLHALSISAK